MSEGFNNSAPEPVLEPVLEPVPELVSEPEPEPGSGSRGMHPLLEIAGLLEQGRLDGDIGTMARVPRSHPEVSAAVLDFARDADERGRDLAALLTALSTLLGTTGGAPVSVDSGTAARLKEFVDSSGSPAEGEPTARARHEDVPHHNAQDAADQQDEAHRENAAHYEDVRFLEDCDPRLIERNTAEYGRMCELLDWVGPSLNTAESAVRSGDPGGAYEDRLEDVRRLAQGLRNGYEAAGKALLAYAAAVEDARRKLRLGREEQDRLAEVISRAAVPITRAAQDAEPMRRWEDLRSSQGLLDRFAELGLDREALEDEAQRCHEQAGEAFGAALRAEQSARGDCVTALERARELIPGFRTPHRSAAATLLSEVRALTHEKGAAAGNALTRLPGGARERGSLPTVGGETVSPLLRDLRKLADGVPAVESWWLTDALGSKEEWIGANKSAIKEAARAYGLPPDLVAGIAWVEVGGKPYVADDVTRWVRHTAESDWSPVTPGNLPGPLAGDRDNTSYGPMAVQVRRAAETLGYDPAALSEAQRDELTASLKDPSQNLLISAKHLADLKAHSAFAEVRAEEMTPEQCRELAARYNGGPYWQGPDAQSYADEFAANRERAEQALR